MGTKIVCDKVPKYDPTTSIFLLLFFKSELKKNHYELMSKKLKAALK